MKNEEIVFIPTRNYKLSSYYKIATLFMCLQFLLFNQVKAQSKNVFAENKNSDGIEKKHLRSFKISGIVADSISKEPIPYVKVQVRINNGIVGFTYCNFDGYYLIDLKDLIENNTPASVEFLQTMFDTVRIKPIVFNTSNINMDTIFMNKSFLALSEIKIIGKLNIPRRGEVGQRICPGYSSSSCRNCWALNRIAGPGINESLKLVKTIDPSPRHSRIDINVGGIDILK